MNSEEWAIIEGNMCKVLSVYKGWIIYRAWDIRGDHGRMLYFAAAITDNFCVAPVKARNLSGIKDAISKVVE